MKTWQALTWVLFFLAASAAAQSTAPATINPAQRAAVKEMLDALNFKQMMTQMAGAMGQGMPQMMDQMIESAATTSKLTPEQKAEARSFATEAKSGAARRLTEMFNDPAVLQGLEDIMTKIYVKHFSTDEIKAITAFHKSPAGKKSLAIMPKVMQETVPEMMAVMQPKMAAMVEQTAKDVVAKAEKSKSTKDAAAAK